MQRAQRKLEHIQYAVELGSGPASTQLSDLRFLHNCLPELDPADLDLSVELLGKRLRLPFFIDAITGSTDAVVEINAQLAQIAAHCGIGLAVGSQYGAVRNGSGLGSYQVVREYDPDGLVLGNLSALATPEQAQAAVDLLEADALELHLNAAQELWMPEGDKNYAGLLRNMEQISARLGVPVVVKETGCGMAAEQYARLLLSGFRCFNCAGAGGTNFPAIEARRSGQQLPKEFAAWGVPTCWSLLDAQQLLPPDYVLLASGGISTAAAAVRAFALGADAVGIAGQVLRLLLQQGAGAVEDYFHQLAEELQRYLLLLGCRTPYELREVPLIFGGATRDFIDCRGYSLTKLSRRRRALGN